MAMYEVGYSYDIGINEVKTITISASGSGKE